jgi:hypothetical protein
MRSCASLGKAIIVRDAGDAGWTLTARLNCTPMKFHQLLLFVLWLDTWERQQKQYQEYLDFLANNDVFGHTCRVLSLP